MFAHVSKFFVLFASVVILLTGHGLQLTLLPLRAERLGFTVEEIGATGSFYFLGFLLGCISIPRFVASVGHIRVFNTTTTLCGAALLLVLLTESVGVWCGLRFATGVGISGCYLIIESWLNEQTQEHLRGRVLAIYTMLVLAAMSLGQVLINVGKPESVAPVVLGSLLLSLAVVPVSLSRVRQPAKLRGVGFKLREVFHAAPAAVGGALGIGMVTGTLYTLTPVFGIRAEMDVADVSLLMIAMVAGGAMFQFPVGRVSDHFDRRRVMVTLLSAGFIVALLAGFLVVAPWALIATLFVSGGVANAIYPICLAHANDRLPGQFMQVGTVILLVNAAGAVVGPLLAAYAMAVFGAPGFFWFMAAGFVLTTAWIGSFIMRREAPLTTRRFVNTAKSSPALMALDPRASAEAEIAQPGSESDD